VQRVKTAHASDAVKLLQSVNGFLPTKTTEQICGGQ